MRLEKLISIRKDFGFTQAKMAEILNISLSFYRKIEQGSRKPGLELAKEIAEMLNSTVEQLFFNSKVHKSYHISMYRNRRQLIYRLPYERLDYMNCKCGETVKNIHRRD